MKFRRSAPTVLIGAVVIAIAVISVISGLIAHQMTASFEEAQFELMGKITGSKLHGAEGKATAGAELIAALPNVRKAFAERNREELLAITKDAFKLQHEKYGISQGQFHLPEKTSFLRLHNPAKFGEDLSSYRQMVIDVNDSKAIRRGLEITTSGVGIFGTVPMTNDAGQHNGSFELALEIGPLLDELKKTYGFELAIYIDEKILKQTATSLGGDILNERNRVGKYVKFYTTHSELSRALVTEEEINIVEDAHYKREVAGLPYGVLLQPVYNFSKKQIGVVAIAQNFKAMSSSGGRAVRWQVLLGLVAAILLTGLILMVIRGMLLQPLGVVSARYAALADGDASQGIEGEDVFCDEVRDLADQYERLRRQQQGDDRSGEKSS